MRAKGRQRSGRREAVEALVTRGVALVRAGRSGEALGPLRMAVAMDAVHARALSALGIALLNEGEAERALDCAAAAFRIARDADRGVDLGRVLIELGRFEEAEAVSREVGAGGGAAALQNRAVALEGLGRHEDALTTWRQALRVAPESGDVRHGLAALLLRLGRFTPEAWALYEGRLNKAAAPDVRCWVGEDVRGRTVLLLAEQGLGDTLQFVRYAPMVAARGARVVLAVPPALLRLLATVPGVAEVVAVGGRIPAFDVVCPLLSLPGVFGTTLDSIPPSLPYWLPAQERDCGGLRVGLVWAGASGFANDRARSIRPGLLAPLVASCPEVRFGSLQFGGAGSADALGIADLMAEVVDFQDTAERVAALDLVIAVDTAVAHLVATMGKPVWLLSRFHGCWRWLLEREDSPWYPSIRIFRQDRTGEWGPVLARVGEALRRLSRDAGSPSVIAGTVPGQAGPGMDT